MLALRYMDDALILLARKIYDYCQDQILANYIQYHMYDQESRTITIKREDTDPFLHKFLDADIHIAQDRSSIKLIWHNKNANFITERRQNVGRFCHVTAPVPLQQKITTISGTFIRIHDFTSYPDDMLLPITQLFFELRSLHYSFHVFQSALHKANRTRRSAVWNRAATFITSLSPLPTPPSL